jgi:uncharacterized NAD(P)/FAD-binding protein YdhS
MPRRFQEVMINAMRFNFAIIGGGLTATAMLCQFVDKVQQKAAKDLLDPSKIGIQVYEKQDSFGPGFPHSDKFALPFHITNMCAADMGIIDGRPGDFEDWVANNSGRLQKSFSWFQASSSGRDKSGRECNHYSRAIMGEYLKARFQEAVQSAQRIGLEVNLFLQSEVIDLIAKATTVTLRIRDLQTQDKYTKDADRVLLATGHWVEKSDQTRYFNSPWPARELMRKIPAGEKVAVIGTSLSAIETLLTLTAEGKFARTRTGQLVYEPAENSRTFCLYSRMGLLPKVRGKMGDYRNKFLNPETLNRLLSKNSGKLSLESIFKLLDAELETAYGQAIDWNEIVNPTGKSADLLRKYIDDAINGDGPNGELIWQTVLHQSFDMVRDIYLNLTLEDRRRFDKHYTSLFFTHAATQPVLNAEKLLALIRAGIVRVVKLGKKYRLAKDNDSDYYEFIYEDDRGNLNRDAYRYVVNARGQERSLETDPSELARNLLASGTVQIEEFRPVDHNTDSGRRNAGEATAAVASYRTGSIWIDPDTHQIMQIGPDEKPTKSSTIYAVGAMTRGQIINASMADGIVQATSRIADDLVTHLS